jgi:hypothetical protein
MIENNFPFGIITKENLDELSKYKCIIFSNVKMMSQKEIDAIKEYVKNGGCIYASKYTSLYHTDGTPRSDFQLKDVMGVSYKGTTKENVTYIAPVDTSGQYLSQGSRKYPLSISGNQTIIEPVDSARVLATITLPYTDPQDLSSYASIHCNPPGITTDNPAVVLNEYGKGRTVYLSTEPENQELYCDVFCNLIKRLIAQPLLIDSDAPKAVEITTFHQADNKRYIVNLCNFQKQLPSIPVTNISVTMNLGDKKVIRLQHLPDENDVNYEFENNRVSFVVSRVSVFEMYAVYYE